MIGSRLPWRSGEIAGAVLVPLALVAALQLGPPAGAQGAGGVVLAQPETLHSNGAELEWTAYDANATPAFSSYEVHRSRSSVFTPSADTLVATIRDRGETSFRDTTAAAATTFTYKLLANGSDAGSRTVALPAEGRATTILQPSPARGSATWIEDPGPTSLRCGNYGATDSLWVGSEPASKRRALLRFDLRDIPAGAAVTRADLALYRNVVAAVPMTIDAHDATRAWREGSGAGTCTGDGASWQAAERNQPWTSTPTALGGGGDYADQWASVSLPAAAPAGWDVYDVKSLTQSHANGNTANLGMLLKVRDESTALTGKAITYLSDNYATASQRPKLTLEYADGSKPIAPRVAVSRPGPGEQVSGTVALAADAGDDGRVAKVEFLVDGAVVATDSTSPYTGSWSSTSVQNGSHTLTARATDDAGNATTSGSVSLTVDNSAKPTTKITSPRDRYEDQVKADGPAAYWRFGETAGTTANDSSGNGRHGEFKGRYTLGQQGLVSGDSDKSSKFSPADGGVSSAALDGMLGSALTVEAWVDFAALSQDGQETRIAARNWTRSGGWLLGVARASGAHRVRFDLDGSAPEASAAVAPGRHHVAATYDGQVLRLYVDGEQAASASQSGASLATRADVQIATVLAGDVVADDVALYGRALTADELRTHYEIGDGRPVSVAGTPKIKADAADDRGVSKVEFYADGVLFHTTSTAPYEADWQTLTGEVPFFDGEHELTTKAYDGSGQVTASELRRVKVANTRGTRYSATLSSTPFPIAVGYDPALDASAQEDHEIKVTVTNTSQTTWPAGDVTLRPRWFGPRGGAAVDQTPVTIPVALAPGQSRQETVVVRSPAPSEGTARALHRLRIDLHSQAGNAFFAAQGNPPLENPVIVQKILRTKLGLESWHPYDSAPLGAGMTHLVNVANGNSLVRWTPFAAPGRGLSTVVDLTYNSLEEHSESPAGNNFSLAISGLTRLGSRLDVHPNPADGASPSANHYVDLVDGDGTSHRFTGTASGDTVKYQEPPGVHLYLRKRSTTDASKTWAVTRPDAVTFFYDADGYPTGVEDRNGNRLEFTLSDVAPADDPGGSRKRVTKVTDAAGLGSTPAPNRSFDIAYWTKDDARKPQIRGKVKRITDHTGSALDFEYYEDGNLMRLVQRGGAAADGSFLPDRRFTFSYTTPAGDAPALADPAQRANPPSSVPSQSTRLYGVIDPLGNETTFTYLGPGNGQDRWKLASRRDRRNHTTTFAYNATTRETTVSAPESRVTKYVVDVDGQPTSVTNAEGETSQMEWTNRHLTKTTEPGARINTYSYDSNGQLLEHADELLHRTCLRYDSLPADAADDRKHLSLLRMHIPPNGVPAAGCASADLGHAWRFDYNAAGNLDLVTDPEGGATDLVPNLDGTVGAVHDPRGNRTDYEYDQNGLPKRVTDPLGNRTQIGYTDDGLVAWIQDPNHVDDTGADERSYRSYFDYDAFHRLGRQSAPVSTRHRRGTLIWSAASYDANDNVKTDIAPHYGRSYSGAGAKTTYSYDAMDNLELETGPDRSADPEGERTRMTYDDADRLRTIDPPRRVQSSASREQILLTYDRLDRVRTRTEGARKTHWCYQPGSGDLVWITAPKANVASTSCPAGATPPSHTTVIAYFLDHTVSSVANALGHSRSFTYDANHNVRSVKNEEGFFELMRYDKLDRLVERSEPLSGCTTIDVACERARTIYDYDPAGNLERLISPRAYDASSDKTTFTNYVTSFLYDGANRLIRTELPSDASTPKAYAYRGYDRNGNMTAISLPVTDAFTATDSTLSAIADDLKKTRLELLDPGWVRTAYEPGVAPVRYGYEAEGWQSSRRPLASGVEDRGNRLSWEYHLDGMLKERTGRDGLKATYSYNGENQLTSSKQTSGTTAPSQRPLEIEATYDALGDQRKARHRTVGESTWTSTKLDYDLNGNVANRYDNGQEDTAGAESRAGRRHEFVYDQADRLDKHTDHGDSGTSDDRLIDSDFWKTGWESLQTVDRRDASGNFTSRLQTTRWTYANNGLLRTLEARNGQNAIVGSHDVTYRDPAGIFVNGHRTKDVFKADGPKKGEIDPCETSACTATYTYDARDRLKREHQQRPVGSSIATDFTYEVAGPLKTEARTGPTSKTITYTSKGLQVDTQRVDSGPTFKYHYDVDGNLDCITTTALSSCPRVQAWTSGLMTDYGYDALNRLTQVQSWATDGTLDDEARYVYDPLDRVVEQTDRHGAANALADGGQTDYGTSTFSHLGLSDQIASETRHGGQDSGGTLRYHRAYGYDAWGHRVTMSRTSAKGTRKDYSYVYDVHGSVSLLLDETGAAKAQYGYLPFGERDDTRTEERDPDSTDPEAKTSEAEPLNPYRYTAKRQDPGSGTLDMGARRFGPRIQGAPQAASFLQRDSFDEADADLALTTDPLNQQRYMLAGGNPITFVETDGHYATTGGQGSRHIQVQGGDTYDRQTGGFTSGSRTGQGPGGSGYVDYNSAQTRRSLAGRITSSPAARNVVGEGTTARELAPYSGSYLVARLEEIEKEEFRLRADASEGGTDLLEVAAFLVNPCKIAAPACRAAGNRAKAWIAQRLGFSAGAKEIPEGAARLIGANRAEIPRRKVTDYALNPSHAVGGHKARVFESAFGFNRGNADQLIAQIRRGVMEGQPIAGKADEWGTRFTVDIFVRGPKGSGIVRTGWIYEPGSLTPRLTTLYPR